MKDKFQVALYTTQELSDVKKMRVLWHLLDDPLVSPKRYDSVERVKIPISPQAVESAAQLYQHEGFLFVRGGKDGFLGCFTKQSKGLSKWHIWLNMSAMQGKRGRRWLDWILRLCGALPVLYGGGFSTAEYDAKHANVRLLPGGGRVSGAIGVSMAEFYQYLPGWYWLTIFGSELVLALGQSMLAGLPGVEVFHLAGEQLAICLSAPIVPDTIEQRLQTQRQLADMVGSQFFFDRHRTDLPFELVPQLANTLSHLALKGAAVAEELLKSASLPLVQLKKSQNHVIAALAGVPHPNPGDLAERLVIFLHTEIKEIFTYSHAALEALNTYFAQHPQRLEYKQEHLNEELIPALGAYIGEVLVRELEGEWVIREPLLDSTISVCGKEIAIFQFAHQVIYEDKRVLEVYNLLAEK